MAISDQETADGFSSRTITERGDFPLGLKPTTGHRPGARARGQTDASARPLLSAPADDRVISWPKYRSVDVKIFRQHAAQVARNSGSGPKSYMTFIPA